MSADDDGPVDDDFTAWAVARDESLAGSDGGAPALGGPTDSRLPHRLEEFEACLRRLERDRRARRDSSAVKQALGPGAGPAALSVPGVLGRFRLQRILGAGGFGVVYLAEDQRLCRLVALKIPRAETLLIPGLRQRFVREAQATARLSHPCILPVFEPGEAGPFLFLVEAYCAGGSLADWLAQHAAPLSSRQATQMLAAVADAVQHAHEHGVLHRDLKPANILLEPLSEGEPGVWKWFPFRPRVGDFGLAKILDLMDEETSSAIEAGTGAPKGAGDPEVAPAENGPDPFLSKARTTTAALLGTPAYMAPEQAGNRRAEIGVATDVYGLGALLYELLARRPPIQGTNTQDTLRRIESEEPAPLRQVRRDVPRELEAICRKCLMKAPSHRYPSVRDLAEDLRRFLAGEPVRARPAGIAERAWKAIRRRPAVAALSGVAATALLCLVAWAARYTVELREHNLVLHDALSRAETGERRLREENYAVEIKLAGTMVGNDPSGVLGELLNGLRPASEEDDLRCFTWYYLWNIGRRDMRLRGHKSDVAAVAISPDGRLCASGAIDGSLRIWDLHTGACLSEWKAHNLGVRRVAFTNQGRNLVTENTWNCAGEIIVWDVATRAEITHRNSKDGGHYLETAVAADRDIVGYADLSVTDVYLGVWNWRTGQNKVLDRRTLNGVSAMTLSPDAGTLAVSDGKPRNIVCWDLASARKRVSGPIHMESVTTLCFAPDGKVLASGSYDGSLKISDSASGQIIAHRELGAFVRKVLFSADGKLLAVATTPKIPHSEGVNLWDMPGCALRPEVLKPGFNINDLAFTPDGQTLAVGCNDRQVHLWRPFAAKAESTLAVRGKKEAWSVAFAPDGQTLAVGYDDGFNGDRETLKLWDVRTEEELANLYGHQAMVSEAVFVGDGGTLVSAGFDNLVKLWDARTRKLLTTLPGHTRPLTCVAASPDGRLLASAGKDKVVKLWDVATGQEQFTFPGETQDFRRVAFAPDGKAIAAVDEQGALRLWDTGTGQSLGVFRDLSRIMALAYAPGGQTLATGNGDGAVRIWDPATGASLHELLGHRGEVRAVVYSPNGKSLASGGDDRTVRLWQASTGRELLVFKDLPQKVNSLAFSPDGRHLAAALHDGSVRLWHAAANGE